jgi:hypothetical protein
MIRANTFKTLSFGNGVNYTAGLGKIRTSQITVRLMILQGKGLRSQLF